MNASTQRFHLIDLVIVFSAMTLLIFLLGDFPQRDIFKEVLSLMTLLAFTWMLGQLFLVRDAKELFQTPPNATLVRLHKTVGYIIIPVLLLHPFLIVAHKAFEPGLSYMQALTTLLTTFETFGQISGMIAWILMLIIGGTSLFRNRLGMKYPAWRLMHGILSLLFIAFASWHVVDMGRHVNTVMSLFFLILAFSGSGLLLRSYYLHLRKE